jgi:pyruvate dehydrogenase phosphatase
MPGLDDTHFRNEFNHLMRVQHPNIMRLVGYCYNLGHQRFKHGGDYIFALVQERVLCIEYLPGGSLDKHISGMMALYLDFIILHVKKNHP